MSALAATVQPPSSSVTAIDDTTLAHDAAEVVSAAAAVTTTAAPLMSQSYTIAVDPLYCEASAESESDELPVYSSDSGRTLHSTPNGRRMATSVRRSPSSSMVAAAAAAAADDDTDDEQDSVKTDASASPTSSSTSSSPTSPRATAAAAADAERVASEAVAQFTASYTIMREGRFFFATELHDADSSTIADTAQLYTSYTITPARRRPRPHLPRSPTNEQQMERCELLIRRCWHTANACWDETDMYDAQIAEHSRQRHILAPPPPKSGSASAASSGGKPSSAGQLRKRLLELNHLRQLRAASARREDAAWDRLAALLGPEVRERRAEITLLAMRVAVGQITLFDAKESLGWMWRGRWTMGDVVREHGMKPEQWQPVEAEMGQYTRAQRAAQVEMNVWLWRVVQVQKQLERSGSPAVQPEQPEQQLADAAAEGHQD